MLLPVGSTLIDECTLSLERHREALAGKSVHLEKLNDFETTGRSSPPERPWWTKWPRSHHPTAPAARRHEHRDTIHRRIRTRRPTALVCAASPSATTREHVRCSRPRLHGRSVPFPVPAAPSRSRSIFPTTATGRRALAEASKAGGRLLELDRPSLAAWPARAQPYRQARSVSIPRRPRANVDFSIISRFVIGLPRRSRHWPPPLVAALSKIVLLCDFSNQLERESGSQLRIHAPGQLFRYIWAFGARRGQQKGGLQ